MGEDKEKVYRIAVAKCRWDKIWKNISLDWGELVAKLAEPKIHPLTLKEFKLLAKPSQDNLKDVGGYVGGMLSNGMRKNGHVSCRSLVTLDYDTFSQEQLDRLKDALVLSAWVVHSTMKHTADAWRCRVIVGLSREVTPDEYGAIARRIAGAIGFEGIDGSTFEPVRMMYWPAKVSDTPYLFETSDTDAPLDVDSVLASYEDWHDMTQWPMLPVEAEALGQGVMPGEKRPRSAAELFAGRGRTGRQEDPFEKKGMIGAFCRTYPIPEALEKFLPEIYSKAQRNRYTHTGSSTTGGALVLEDGRFFYSFHATDPLQGRLLNSWDLVRLAKYGGADFGTKETHVNRLPSSKAMEELAANDPKVRSTRFKERIEPDAFAGMEIPAEGAEGEPDEPLTGIDLIAALEQNRDGFPKEEPYNVKMVILHDPLLAGCVRTNWFTGNYDIVSPLPWKRGDTPYYEDSDDDQLLCYLNQKYRFKRMQVVRSCLQAVANDLGTDPVKDYLDGLQWDGVERLPYLFTRVIGADDTELNRRLAVLLFTAAVRRTYKPGEKFDYFIILQGPEGCGKSSVFEMMGGKWFSDSIKDIGGKNGMEALQGVWISELAELVASKRRDAEQMKSFISSCTDKYRPAYGRKTVVRPRRAILVGTTNETNFLSGVETGNRRSPVVVCKPELRKEQLTAREYVIRWRDQLWAEAKHHHETDFQKGLFLPDSFKAEIEAIQDEFNRDRQDPRFGEIDKFLDMWLPDGGKTGDSFLDISSSSTAWEDFTLEQRRTWLKENQGRDFEGCAGYRQRDTVCMAEILQEFFCMEKTDRDYIGMSRRIGSYLNSKKDVWSSGSSGRIHIYGKQKLWRRVGCESRFGSSFGSGFGSGLEDF